MSIDEVYDELCQLDGVQVLRSERLAHHTSLRIGGPCALHISCDTVSALGHVLDLLYRERIRWVILGKGSNLLVADEGYDGAVISLGSEFARMGDTFDDTYLSVGAAAVLSRLVSEAQRRELSGLEFCTGIPGTVGGALAMNAGTRNEWIGSRVRELVCYRPGEGLIRYAARDIDWGYRTMSVPSTEIILEATLELEPSSKERIGQDMERRLVRRRRAQPMGLPSCGSVFRNPVDGSAGEMIETCGLKGERAGGARISEVHANFIVNEGSASAADVVELMRRMHTAVLERFEVDLQPEVKFLGFGSA